MHRLGTGVLVVLVGCVTGCSSILGIDDFKLGDAGTTSGDILSEGAPVDAPANCLGPAGFVVCLEPLPTTRIDFNNAATSNINTDTSSLCLVTQPPSWKAAGHADACFVVATSIAVTVRLRATGARPLVLVAAEAVQISADIDVSSIRGSPGAGAPGADCMIPPPGVGAIVGGGGGAGGSFMTKGGGGGMGGGGAAGGGSPGADTAQPIRLRGGCSGSRGGPGNGSPGAAGVGGGAVYVVARNGIGIEAAINVSGAGGESSGLVAGGSGGGSGGMIVLHADQIIGAGRLVANGGGGSGGSGGNQVGGAGADPSSTNPTTSAQGGPGGGGSAGVGGRGFAGMTIAASGTSALSGSGAGGGGGGGASGYIRTNRALPTIVASPAPSLVP